MVRFRMYLKVNMTLFVSIIILIQEHCFPAICFFKKTLIFCFAIKSLDLTCQKPQTLYFSCSPSRKHCVHTDNTSAGHLLGLRFAA